jgi:hypothetical protein
MQKVLKITFLLLLPLFLRADFEIGNWLFFKEIILPSNLPQKAPVAIPLDFEVFLGAKKDLSDLRIVEGKENEIPFTQIKKGSEEITLKVKILSPSSIKKPTQDLSFDPERMIDKNLATYFEIDQTIDPKTASFILDLGRKTQVQKIKIHSLDPLYTWISIEIDGSDDLKNWEKVKSKIALPFSNQREISLEGASFRYLKLSFEHTGSLKIHEIEIYTSPEIYLLFLGEKGKNYFLFYGNDLAQVPKYQVELSLENAFFGSLGKAKENPRGRADFDQDGISNQKDNCPFNFNPDQSDKDGDGFGDICDNCPDFKNPTQEDLNKNKIGDICEDDDNDKIVNILDNCPKYFNPNQKDENKNGIGDACEDWDNDGVINDKDNCPNESNFAQEDKDKDGIGDACDPTDDRFTEKYSWILWVAIGCTAFIVGFLSFRLVKNTQ